MPKLASLEGQICQNVATIWSQMCPGGEIQRLVRDGVDSPLGDLFANMALPAGADSAAARQPRASEAFLFTASRP
jgi:hypothetical protein